MEFNWYAIISIVLFILTIFSGIKWVQAKRCLEELAEALTSTSNALADDKITDDERKRLLTEWADVIVAARDLFYRKL